MCAAIFATLGFELKKKRKIRYLQRCLKQFSLNVSESLNIALKHDKKEK